MRVSRRLSTNFMKSGSILLKNLKTLVGGTNAHCCCRIRQKCGVIMIHPPLNTLQSALEEELEKVRKTVDNLQSKLRVGLEIENHLKKKVHELEKKQIYLVKVIMNEISELSRFHSQHRADTMDLLNEEKLYINSICSMIEEQIKQIDLSREQNLRPSHTLVDLDENECRDVHMSNDIDRPLVSKEVNHSQLDFVTDKETNCSEALAQAMQEKVAALLLLSQQEERYLLESNVNAALQKKLEERQRNLLQVTNEKVKALMELAQLRQEYQQLQEKLGLGMQGNSSVDSGDKRLSALEKEGKLRNLLKRTYLRRWMGAVEGGNEEVMYLNDERNISSRRSGSIDFARMKIENATLKESIESMEYLNTTVHRLRLALRKVNESVSPEGKLVGMSGALADIISEAKLLKTAFSSSLPVSWSAEADDSLTSSSPSDFDGESGSEKVDPVSGAGLEMVELLILAAQILKDYLTRKVVREGS